MNLKKGILLLLSFGLAGCSNNIQTNTEGNYSFSVKSFTNGLVQNTNAAITYAGNWNTVSDPLHSDGSIARSFPFDANSPSSVFEGSWTNITDNKFTDDVTRHVNSVSTDIIEQDNSGDAALKYSNDAWARESSTISFRNPGAQTTTVRNYNDASITYNGTGWTADTSKTPAFMTNTSVAGSNITFTFSGTEASIGVIRSADRGKIRVSVYNNSTSALETQFTKDLYLASGFRNEYINISLPNSITHRVVIEPDSTNTPTQKYDLERIVIHPANIKMVHYTDPTVVYKQNNAVVSMESINTTNASNFRLSLLSSSRDPFVSHITGTTADTSIEIPFNGTNILVSLIRSTDRGIINFKILDSQGNIERNQNIDLYNPTWRYDWVNIHSLKMGNHKLVISPTGTKNAAATAFKFDFNKAFIYPAFEYSFIGPEITYNTNRDASGGKVRVSFDNNPTTAQSVDLSNATTVNANVFSINNLSKGSHTITVEATHEPSLLGRYRLTLDHFKSTPRMRGLFSGSEINLLTVKKSNHGMADLYIDDIFNQTIDFYHPSTKWLVVPLNISGLSNTPHTYTLVGVTGKNPASSGNMISIDSILNSKASYTFRSDKIVFNASKGLDQGMVDIYLDTVYQGTVDLFSASPLYNQVIFSKTSGLTYGVHTIEVRPSGQKNASSDGYGINIDSFDSRTSTISGGVGGE